MITYPPTHVYSREFRYVPAAQTNLAEKWAAFFIAQRKLHEQQQRKPL